MRIRIIKVPKQSLYSKGGIIQNAAKWHHADGGYVQGGTYDLDEAEIQRLIDAGYQIQYE